jgi:hypothetical protein
MYQTRNEIGLQQILLVEFLFIEKKRANCSSNGPVLFSDIYVYGAKISENSIGT